MIKQVMKAKWRNFQFAPIRTAAEDRSAPLGCGPTLPAAAVMATVMAMVMVATIHLQAAAPILPTLVTALRRVAGGAVVRWRRMRVLAGPIAAAPVVPTRRIPAMECLAAAEARPVHCQAIDVWASLTAADRGARSPGTDASARLNAAVAAAPTAAFRRILVTANPPAAGEQAAAK